MKKILLGGKAEVTQCCLGTMTWGVQNSEAEAHEQLDHFVGQGGTFIDTAEMYPVPPSPEVVSRTETYIGNWIQSHPERRKDIFLATKVAGPRPGSWIEGARKRKSLEEPLEVGETSTGKHLTKDNIMEACDASLRRLQTDYLDLYQIHWPERYIPLFGSSIFEPADKGHMLVPSKKEHATVEEQVQTMGELITQGKIKHWGLSNETSYGVCLFCQTADRLGVARPVSIQNDFSLLDRRFETELAETCYHLNVSLLAYGPLCGGALSGKYLQSYTGSGSAGAESRPANDSRHVKFPKFQSRYAGAASAVAAEKYAKVAASKGVSPTTLALAWCTTRFYIKDTGAVIIGATTMPQLKENMDALKASLDAETLSAIDKIHCENPNPNCDHTLGM
mmetsp:Transcript_14776/g.33605  ORF Transcript_14776/g.33605 Transcript_14776/m.33605 type:complete len:392 (-) Transcript_14776:92-1267(-)